MPVSGSDVDLLKQALTNSGLTNGNVASSAASSVTLSESVLASDSMNKNAATLTDVSSFNGPPSLASSRPARLNVVSTMAVHDSVTGMIRRHPVRKVVLCVTSGCCSAVRVVIQ